MAWPILHNHVCLSASLHSFTVSVSYTHFCFLGNLWFWKLWFIHSVLSLLNLFVIKELSFCMWMFCFMKWVVLLWFPLFILLCYSVKLGKHLFVYKLYTTKYKVAMLFDKKNLPIEWPCNSLNPYMVGSTLQLINTHLRT